MQRVDRGPGRLAMRQINRWMGSRRYEKVLGALDRLIASGKLSSESRARLVCLVGELEYRRGRYREATRYYLKGAQLGLADSRVWFQGLLGTVRAYLRVPEAEQAIQLAEHAWEVAEQRWLEFEGAVKGANRQLAQEGRVKLVPEPVHPVEVATRLGYAFWGEGEVEIAQQFFERALARDPKGATRARIGLAEVAMARGEPYRALKLSEEALRRGCFSSKTLRAWRVHIRARRRLGGWRIKTRLMENMFERAPKSVQARAVLEIADEMRKQGMRQWEEVATEWLSRSGRGRKTVRVELLKKLLASAKVSGASASRRRELALQLLQEDGVKREDWRAAAKEYVKASYEVGANVDVREWVQKGIGRFGDRYGVVLRHSLALACMVGKRHEVARVLLQANLKECREGSRPWTQGVWAMGRMEELLGREKEAASWYRRCWTTSGVPMKFRLAAWSRWARIARTAEDWREVYVQRTWIEKLLRSAGRSEAYLDFARQVPAEDTVLRSWREEIFREGVKRAWREIEESTQPEVATEKLSKLARRQVYDFRDYAAVIESWEQMSWPRREWLWNQKEGFWEYLSWVLEAYGWLGRQEEAEGFARGWLEDAATPAVGWAWVGTKWGQWLMRWGRAKEALEIFEGVVQRHPTHGVTGPAWYWKALWAWKQGRRYKSEEYARAIRSAQGCDPLLQDKWEYDLRALLILEGMDPTAVARKYANYSEEEARVALSEMQEDLKRLP